VTTRIAVNGVIGDETAQISVLDRGFLYGDSVYEVIRTYGGQPFALEAHLSRLERSAALLGFPVPVSTASLAHEIRAAVQAAGNAESYIRVIVTRGSGPITLDPSTAERPCRVVIVTSFTPYPASLYDEGAKICLVPAGRLSGGAVPLGAKSGNYLVNIMALRSARRQGAHEAVMLDTAGRVAEGASSNVFALVRRTLRTPPLSVGILEGITRHLVIELARRMDLDVEETELLPADLRGAGEIFLTSTLREVMPVTHVDDWEVGDGRVGPIALELRRRYRAEAEPGGNPPAL
jgi:branched-chain amino acid aminotransferase